MQIRLCHSINPIVHRNFIGVIYVSRGHFSGLKNRKLRIKRDKNWTKNNGLKWSKHAKMNQNSGKWSQNVQRAENGKKVEEKG